MPNDEVTKLADLPARWEAEAEEIDQRMEAGEVSGEVWEARRDILMENAVDLRLALTRLDSDPQEAMASSAFRMVDWLGTQSYPEDPAPETNDICDWALAKLQEQSRELENLRSLQRNTPEHVDSVA